MVGQDIFEKIQTDAFRYIS